MTPDIQFQPDRIFTRNYLFERIIKNGKATNAEFLMLNEKLGLCPYEVICSEEDFVLMPEIQDDIEELKKENKESIKIKISEESAEEPIETKISEESAEEPIETKISEESAEESMKIKISEESAEDSVKINSPKKDENATDW